MWEINASSWFHYKKFNTMYGHINLKDDRILYELERVKFLSLVW
jgi:hypothetical protein